MSMQAVIIAAIIVGGVGIFIGFFLGISGEKFKVEVDEREEAILGVLPGNNCGGCGYAGCSGLAAAIVKGEAPVGGCPVGGDPVAAKVGFPRRRAQGRRHSSNAPEPVRRPGGIMNIPAWRTAARWRLCRAAGRKPVITAVLDTEAA